MYSIRGAVTWKSTVGTNVASDALANQTKIPPVASGYPSGDRGIDTPRNLFVRAPQSLDPLRLPI